MQNSHISTRSRAGLTFAEQVAVARKRIKEGSYLIRRHGGWFRPGAHGYTRHLSEAGIFTAEQARAYIDVDGLSVAPVGSILAGLDEEIADLESRLAAARKLRGEIEEASNAE
ncbi:MAG: hypothetical protein ACLGJC_13460 [Alphaproteobacteria bacterium]